MKVFSVCLVFASLLFAVQVTQAQSRGVGAQAVVLDNGSGNTITIQTPASGWSGNISFQIPIPPSGNPPAGFVHVGTSLGQILDWNPSDGVQGAWDATTLASLGGITGTGTSGTFPIWSGASAQANSLLTDNGSMLSYNGGKLTVATATGNTAVAGTLGVASDFNVNGNFNVTAATGNTGIGAASNTGYKLTVNGGSSDEALLAENNMAAAAANIIANAQNGTALMAQDPGGTTSGGTAYGGFISSNGSGSGTNTALWLFSGFASTNIALDVAGGTTLIEPFAGGGQRLVQTDNSGALFASNTMATALNMGTNNITNGGTITGTSITASGTVKIGGHVVATSEGTAAETGSGVIITDNPVFVITGTVGGTATSTLPGGTPVTGDLIVVINDSNTAETIGAATLAAGASRSFYYDGTAWK